MIVSDDWLENLNAVETEVTKLRVTESDATIVNGSFFVLACLLSWAERSVKAQEHSAKAQERIASALETWIKRYG